MKYWVDTVANNYAKSPRAIACQRFWAIALAKGALSMGDLPWRVSTTETLRSRFRTTSLLPIHRDDAWRGSLKPPMTLSRLRVAVSIT